MKHIKVTKGEHSAVVLASNEAFYKAQGYTISEPKKTEIEAAFPEEKKVETAKVDSSAKKALEEAQKALEAANVEKSDLLLKIETEISAHNETKKALEEAQKALEAAKQEIEKLPKK
jgi:hypothetical protein